MEIIGSIILSIVQSVLFFGKEIGISMIFFVIIFNGIVLYILHKKHKIQNRNGLLLMIPIFLLSNTFFLFANKTFYNTNIIAIAILSLIMYIIAVNPKDYFRNYILKMIELVKDTITNYKDGIVYTKDKSMEHVNISKNLKKLDIKKVTISLAIVFMIVIVVLILLASADQIFANLFSWMGNINIDAASSIILRFLIIVLTYFLFLNLVIKIQKGYHKEEKKLKKSNGEYSYIIKLLLIILNLVYVVFCYIQIKSLFAKINISGEFDYASYARTGFFQLMYVSFINLGVILVSNRYNEKREKIIKILNLLLIFFTTIIAVSSMYRMHMYEIEYGLTYLRFFVYIILVTEIIAFVPLIVYTLNEKFDYIKWCFIIIISSYCITNYMNIEKIIVSKNINRINTHPVDYDYIAIIASEDSYNILQKKLVNENTNDGEKMEILEILQNIEDNTKILDWQEFNLSKYKMLKTKIILNKLRIQMKK